MKRIVVVLLTVLFGGCYTQLQIPERKIAYQPVHDPPEPIVIVIPQPYYPPRPCPAPRPLPPSHPVVVQPTTQEAVSPAEPNRIRTNGPTRDVPVRDGRDRNTGRR